MTKPIVTFRNITNAPNKNNNLKIVIFPVLLKIRQCNKISDDCGSARNFCLSAPLGQLSLAAVTSIFVLQTRLVHSWAVGVSVLHPRVSSFERAEKYRMSGTCMHSRYRIT